ncbi:MAG: hypothetical protein ACR2PK_03490 [Acidimicrobiales bacterium]
MGDNPSSTEDSDGSEESTIETRPQAEVEARDDENELLARALRIRERADELIAALGPDHPLVDQALQRADALEREARQPGQIHLRP